MKVLFINPPADRGVRMQREGRCMQHAGTWSSVWSPLSLACCAAVLREAGHEVGITDCIAENISFRGLEGVVGNFAPELAVINTATPSIVSDLYAADTARKVNSRIRTAVIGVHVTALPEEVLRAGRSVDFAVRGEPEMTVMKLCGALAGGGDAWDVDGISYMKDGSVVHNGPAPFITDLDALPYPAYDLIKTEKYTLPFSGDKFLLVSAGRGCPHRCGFCTEHVYYGSRLRLRTPAGPADEVLHWRDALGVRSFFFWSPGFTLDRANCAGLAEELLRRNAGVEWMCNSRVDDVDGELLALFRRAGCRTIGFGIESGDDEVLRGMRKGIDTAESAAAVRAAKEAGLEVVANVVVGHPGDSEASIRRTIHFVKRLGVDYAQFYCAVPFPGTQLYSDAKKNGRLASEDWRRYEQSYSVLNLEGLTPKRIMKLRKRAFREFYLRPGTVLRILGKFRKSGTFADLPAALRFLRKWF